MPGLLRIGYSQRPDAAERVDELSDNAAVPLPYVLEFEQAVERPDLCAGRVHERLAKYRVAADKEFFRVDVETAAKAIRKEVQASDPPPGT